MSRLEAARKTAATVALVWLFAWLLDRWPAATVATVSVGSIYATYRREGERSGT